MTCSPFQLAANRLNAQKSTGPNTLDGKSRSRRNSYKHGLTGSGIALPEEDAAEVQERFEALEAELRPGSVLARVLVQRVALFSIRLERSARHETVYLSEKIRGSVGQFDEDRASEVDRLFAYLVAEPAAVLRRLKRMPEGIERLISGWSDLRHDLIRDGGGFWSGFHRERAENLTGRHCQPHRVSRIRALDAGLGGDKTLLDPADLAHDDIVGHCRDEMARLIDSEVEKLRAELANLDRDALDQDRAEAVDRALFDPSKEAILARKYEAAAERGMYKALDRIEEIRGRVVGTLPPRPEDVEPDPIPEAPRPTTPETPPSLPKGSVASFFPVAAKPEADPKPPASTRKVTREYTGAKPAAPEPDPVQPPARSGRNRSEG